MLTKLSRQFFSLTGRICRATLWWSTASVWLAFVVLFVTLETLSGRASTLIIYPFFFWAMLALCVKRYHDLGKSGIWLALVVIPVLGVVWVVVELAFRKGGHAENQFGSDPNTREIDYLKVN